MMEYIVSSIYMDNIQIIKLFDNIYDFMYCRVIECSELTIKNGSCDPFATVTVIYSNGKQISKRTKVKKKTASPYFNETFIFEVRKCITHCFKRENTQS